MAGYDCGTCSERSQRQRGCRLQGRTYLPADSITVDYHKPSKQSLDEILFCPASVPGIYQLQQDAYELVAIRDADGLREHFGVAHAQLPEALVNLYRDTCDASERFAAEVRAASKGER